MKGVQGIQNRVFDFLIVFVCNWQFIDEFHLSQFMSLVLKQRFKFFKFLVFSSLEVSIELFTYFHQILLAQPEHIEVLLLLKIESFSFFDQRLFKLNFITAFFSIDNTNLWYLSTHSTTWSLMMPMAVEVSERIKTKNK